ncbi:pirin family protein [Pedobacter rhizosphaerae]|uniref:Pirin N-terminal domain-containing protein n=1 Tax=Pedobacter rhizosphaerae TaxID=390241 RepID=A0A1H9JV57_9SPHI|nr:pirin family protein [Pedobacter rhizosphaerae]SEQ90425.1 hypothetical protein SAMN04488023_10277 [Pedobacter rhizosphaerae]
MSQFILHPANTRGHANHGWLNAHHSFSFANYYNPDRMHFGVLRVLNDDLIDGGMGFGAHPHDNMEIITIPLAGAIAHKDSMGNSAVIKSGEIQVMSAGTGVSHSEFNANADEQLNLLQIWLFPKQKNVTPRYDQQTLNVEARHNNFQQILSPNADDEGVWIHQDAWFSLGKFDNGFKTDYKIKKTGNGVYAFVISGEVTINGQKLGTRDAIGVWDTDTINFQADCEGAEVLLMDVPMELN